MASRRPDIAQSSEGVGRRLTHLSRHSSCPAPPDGPGFPKRPALRRARRRCRSAEHADVNVRNITVVRCFPAHTHAACIATASIRFGSHDPGAECCDAMLQETSDGREADFPVLAFTDESDRAWEVREIRDPGLPERAKRLLGEYSNGWLLFVSGAERRRLAPYAPGWRHADATCLRCWVNDALPVRPANPAVTSDRVCELPPMSPSSQDPV